MYGAARMEHNFNFSIPYFNWQAYLFINIYYNFESSKVDNVVVFC